MSKRWDSNAMWTKRSETRNAGRKGKKVTRYSAATHRTPEGFIDMVVKAIFNPKKKSKTWIGQFEQKGAWPARKQRPGSPLWK